MELKEKKILQSILYYFSIALTIIASVFFMITLAARGTMMYARVVYYIWTAVLIVTLLFDIMCTMMHRFKFITGIVLFVLAILSIVMGIIIYFDLSAGAMLVATNIGLFNRLAVYSFVLIGMSVFTFIAGEFLTQSYER